MTEQTNRSAAYQAASPHPDLKSLEKLVGMWNLSGDTLDYVYEPSYGISNKFHLRGYSPSFFSALYLEGSKIGAVFPGGS